MTPRIRYLVRLREQVAPTGTWGIRVGFTRRLTCREWTEAQRRGAVRVGQGHGIWTDVPLALWTVTRTEVGLTEDTTVIQA